MGDPGSIPLVVGTVIAGKYRLERLLARGGMGSVWVARHLALDEPVAIKLISISDDDLGDAEVRLQREAKSAARLRSPHVVQLLDYGADHGVPYIVMELLSGEDLGERIKRKGRLSLATAAAIAEQVAKALRRAHKAGIIHRDLKPANVFLARVDDEEIVKLLDFGIVKAVRGTLTGSQTQTNMLIGSPNYMSPEQTAAAKDIDHRTDLWSLGAILFEAITGRMAFTGGSLVAVLMNIRSGPLPVATEVAPDLPLEVDAFFARAFERDRALRFPSARAMAAEFSSMVKRLGPRAARVGSSPAFDPNAVQTLTPSDAVEVTTEVTVQLEERDILLSEDVEMPASVASLPASEHISYASTAPPPMMPGFPATMGSPAAPPVPRFKPPEREPPKVVVAPRKPAGSGVDLLRAMRPGARKAMGSALDLGKPTSPPPPPEPRKPMDSVSEMEQEAAGAPWRSTGRVGALIDQGFAALRRGDREGARRSWQDALKLEPSNRTLELNLRRLSAKKG